jgi:hypothetical protein
MYQINYALILYSGWQQYLASILTGVDEIEVK